MVATPRIKVPEKAKKGDVVEIKTTISHEMESGQRKDKDGKTIPRQILNKFVCTFNGQEVMSSDWHPAISANPYLSFFLRVNESGKVDMRWTDDNGGVAIASASITVE